MSATNPVGSISRPGTPVTSPESAQFLQESEEAHWTGHRAPPHTSGSNVINTSYPLTIEEIHTVNLNGDVMRGLKYSPDGKRVTFLQGDPQSIWEYEIASGEKKVLVEWNQLGPLQEYSKEEKNARERKRETATGITSYEWIDGKTLMFPLNGKLYLHQIGGTTEQLDVKSVGEPRLLEISPTKRYISFIENGNIMLYNRETGEKRALTDEATETRYFGEADFLTREDLYREKGYDWSPDEKWMIYQDNEEKDVDVLPRYVFNGGKCELVTQRYPAAGKNIPVYRLHLVNIETSERFEIPLDNHKEWYISRINWSPDSSKIAIQMISRLQDTLQLLYFDVASKELRCQVEEKHDKGVNFHDDFAFTSDGFIWSSSRDGYKHLYRYKSDGTSVQLTKGEWCVDRLCSFDDQFVYFQGFAKTPTENHFYRVSINGGPIERLDVQDGDHHIVVAPDKQTFLMQFSNTTTPPQVSLHKISGERITFIAENRLDKTHPYYKHLSYLPKVEFGKISASDGQDLHYRMTLPAHFNEIDQYPVIVTVYGGPMFQSVKNSWMSGPGRMWEQVMAQKGYIIFTLDNRGSSNRGRKFEDCIHKKFGTVEVEDQIAGVNFLKSKTYVDGNNVGIYGWSYGGYMALMCRFKHPEVFTTAIAGAPPVVWEDYEATYTDKYLGIPYERDADVIPYINPKGTGILVIQGGSDDNVRPEHTYQLVETLRKEGIQHEVLYLESETHMVHQPYNRIACDKRKTEHFERHLKRKALV